MKKFPVVSPVTGREYLVKISHRHISMFDEDLYDVSVYVKKKFFRWERNIRVNDSFGSNYYGANWNYDLITMALREIEKLEEEALQTDVNLTLRELGEKAFMEWDGITIPKEETE